VVEPRRDLLTNLAARLRDGRLKPIVGTVLSLDKALGAFAPREHVPGKTIIRVSDRRRG
jgi:NADPH:quinone reductase-like Zn-dependent oxidoreductase